MGISQRANERAKLFATMEMNAWTKLGTTVAVLGTLSGVGWTIWDHSQSKAQAAPTIQGNGNVVGSTTVSGSGNIVNNRGTVTVNSGHLIPASEREAARQRLHDSGIEYDGDRYAEAIQHHESDVVDLFTKAGMRMNTSQFLAFAGQYDPTTAKVLEQVDQSSACPTDDYNASWYLELKGEPLSFLKRVCGIEAVRARLRATLQNEHKELVKAQEDDKTSEARRQHEVESCEQAYMEAFRSLATRQAAQESCYYQHPGEFQPVTPKYAAKIPLTEKALHVLE